jgi:hypothetical protein
LARSKNVVTQLNANFDAGATAVPAAKLRTDAEKEQRFNLKWLQQNKLQTREAMPDETKDVQRGMRVDVSGKPSADRLLPGNAEANRVANDLGRKVAEDAKAQQAIKPSTQQEDAVKQLRDVQRGGEIDEQLERYRLRLEQQQAGQTANAPGQDQVPTESDRPMREQDGRRFSRGGTQPQSGMGGGGFGPGSSTTAPAGEQAAGLAGQANLPPQAPVAGLKSLQVEFPDRGVEYLFVTPRGEIEITARAIKSNQWQRLLQLTGLVVVLAVGGFSVRTIRRFRRR